MRVRNTGSSLRPMSHIRVATVVESPPRSLPVASSAAGAQPNRSWPRIALFIAVLVGSGALLGSALIPQRDPYLRIEDHPPPDAQTLAQINNTAHNIDRVLAAGWQAHAILPANSAADLTVMRRLSLALRGTIPSLEEIRIFESLPQAARLEWWLADILADKRYADYTAERFARAWVGVENGPFLIFRRRRFVSWVSEQVLANKPFDELVAQLITANGIWMERPEVNFLTVTIDNDDNVKDPKPNIMAARTARAFLGVRMDCAECHDHPFDPRWTQASFEGLAAFYGQARQVNFSGIQDDETHEYRVDDLKTGQPRQVPPQVPFARELLPATGSRRERLAAWITHPDNPTFARATANRVWAMLFGKPLVDPVDDVPPATLQVALSQPGEEYASMSQASSGASLAASGTSLISPGATARDTSAHSASATDVAPALSAADRVLDLLADDFVAHDYNLQRLIRVIAATQAFQRESRRPASRDPHTPGLPSAKTSARDDDLSEDADLAEVAAENVWAEFPLVRLRPEQMIGGLLQAGSLRTIDDQSHIVTQLIRFLRERGFVERYGDAGSDEFADSSGTIPQSLLIMNGDLAREVIEPEPLNSSARIAELATTNEHAIEIAYLALLTRRPSEQETQGFLRLWEEQKELGRRQLVYDLYWILMNSTEFRWNH
jgi:hypothetical protein